MHASLFDDLTYALGHSRSRRRLIRLFGRVILAAPSRRLSPRALIALGLATGHGPDVARAKKGKKKRKRNAFGCVNVGRFCQNDGQCCSNICQGKQGKKRCRAHDAGSCQAGDDSCQGGIVPCGMDRRCFRTTGNGSFCTGFGGYCFECKKDLDCPEELGPGRACVVCAVCAAKGGTACYPVDL